MYKDTRSFIEVVKQDKPKAYARIKGSRIYKEIQGTILFYEVPGGVIVYVEVCGLPTDGSLWGSMIHGFHIHEGKSCTGDDEDPFKDAGDHYNPTNRPHPYHAGDLPPLFGNNGYSWTVFATNRFTVDEVIGRAVIIHKRPDDFTTQPSGNAGERIACGVIKYS
ncbi:MAG: superoxide dismutase family protein [Clostridiales bacterium]|nr:superoxide dismutase family protein [Clostridiales bacterium]